MSKEIKFRAFIKKLKWMVPVVMIDFTYNTVEVDLSYGNGDTSEYDFDEVELMQYTGLKGKRGLKEIYEGDIMRNVKNGRIATVQWHGTMAGFVLSNLKEKSQATREWGELFRIYDKYEIIGNIHENLELLVQE